MDQLAHRLQPGGRCRLEADGAERLLVGEPLEAALAVVEIGGEVQPLHGGQL
ncbi:hypothetical protein FQZ97_882940 [compost metagenome]